MTERVLRWTGAVVVVVVLVAGQAPGGEPRKKPVKPAPVIKVGEPAAHGFREADLEGLRAILRKAVADKAVPGVALLLAHRGEIVFQEGFGDLQADQAVKMASDTKPVAATVVMTVVDQGKMRLDDPLTKFVPEFKGTKVEKATVRQLLSHSAGIGDKSPGGWPRANTLAEFAAAVATQGTLQEPGKFRYSSVSIDLACRCAEKAAGRPFEELARERLWEPLEMKHTRFAWGGDAEAVPKEARERGEGRYISGGGGLSSTLEDMAAFYQMHLNGGRYGDKQVLSRKAVAEMHRRQAAAPRGMGYGLGFFLIGPAFQHGGAFGTFCWADSSRQLVGIFFCQAGARKTGPVLIAVQKKLVQLVPVGR